MTTSESPEPGAGPPEPVRQAEATSRPSPSVSVVNPPTVPPIPAAIQALKAGALPAARADLVNRIAHRLHDRNPATYGFLRRWINAAADGVAGALEALTHGYAKAEAALLSNHPCPGRVLVRRVQDFVYRPPAPSTIGAVAAHVAVRPVPLAAAVEEPVVPLPSVTQVIDLEAQVREGDRGLRRLRRQHLVELSRSGPEVPPEVQLAAAAALGRLGSAQQ